MTARDNTSGDEGSASSPRNRVKFRCSYGGKILPKPGDTNLKYVGGETRVVAVPRDIKFSELMKKLNAMVEGDMILKYQVIPEELDALVTVKCDEDLKHMVDEYQRLENEGSPKLRAFLFPLNPVIVETQMNPVDPFAIEQRFIEAINGIVRPGSNTTSGRLTPVNPNSRCFSISSCSSPKSASPDDGYHRLTIQKVQSSPSLYSLHPQSNNLSSTLHQVYQAPHHYYHQYHQQQVQACSAPSPRVLPQEFRTDQKPPTPSTDFGRGPMAMGHGHVPVNQVYSTGKHNFGNYGYGRCGCCYDECLVYANGGLIRRCSFPASGRLDKPGSPGNHIWD
ncbi:hypothetical protein PTKIN_Ptkin10aG0191400 [Pterospermum kingtungense]